LKISKRYLTTKQAMKYTGMGESTLLWLFKDVVIQPGGSGTRRFFDKKDIDHFMKKNKGKYEKC